MGKGKRGKGEGKGEEGIVWNGVNTYWGPFKVS